MYEKISHKITNTLILHKFISAEEFDVYSFCFQILLSTIVSTILILFWSFLFHQTTHALFFFIGFFVSRKLCGGYHAKNQITCFIFTQLIFISFITLITFSNIIESKNNLVFFSLFSNLIILFFAPVDNINNPFCDSEKKKFRKKSIIFTLINLSLLLLIISFSILIDKYFCYTLGVFTVSIMLVLGKIGNITSLKQQNLKKGELNNEKI